MLEVNLGGVESNLYDINKQFLKKLYIPDILIQLRKNSKQFFNHSQ
jgi:hypothetical protein